MNIIEKEHKELCREVRRLREALGLTLGDLAQRSGLSPNFLGTVEKAKRNPSLSTLQAIASGLGIRTAGLFRNTCGLSAIGVEIGMRFDIAPEEIKSTLIELLSMLDELDKKKPRSRSRASGSQRRPSRPRGARATRAARSSRSRSRSYDLL